MHLERGTSKAAGRRRRDFQSVASSDRSGKRPSRNLAKSRPRRKVSTATQPSACPVTTAHTEPTTEDLVVAEGARNVGSLEAVLSLGLGGLLVLAALFPRSFRQLLMLGIGAGLLYRGTTGRCEVYRALGVDTASK